MSPEAGLWSGPLAIVFAASIATISGPFLLYPVLPAIAQGLRVDSTQVGLVMAVFTAPAIVTAPLFGILADLTGRRRILLIGSLIFGTGGVLAGLAPTFGWLLVWRAVQGVGLSALLPLTIVLISDLLPEEREIDGQGWKVAIDRIAMVALPLVGGALSAISWRASFLPYGLTFLLAAAAYRWMPETAQQEPITLKAYLRSTWTAVRQRHFRVAFGVGFLRFFLDYGLFTYLPLLLAFEHGASAVATATIIAASAVGSIITAIGVGTLARNGSAERLLALAFLACGAALALIASTSPLWLAGLASFVFGLGNGLISPLQKNLLTRRTLPSQKGGVVAVDRLIQQLAKSLAPSVLGLVLLVAQMNVLFWTLAALSLAGTISLVFARPAHDMQ